MRNGLFSFEDLETFDRSFERQENQEERDKQLSKCVQVGGVGGVRLCCCCFVLLPVELLVHQPGRGGEFKWTKIGLFIASLVKARTSASFAPATCASP